MTAAAVLLGCSSDTMEKITDGIDLAQGVPRKQITRSKTGVNAFFNQAEFGTIEQQYREITQTLGIKHLRVLIDWNDQVQPTPSARPNLGLADDVLRSAPAGVDLLLILTNVPSWMANRANWIDGNPRTTFVRRWVEPIVARYGSNPAVVGFQIWNEPNFPGRFDNSVLQLENDPANFVELVAQAHAAAKRIAPQKLVVNGATTAINQNFPNTLNYNRGMRDAGILSFTDKFAMHYYGRQYENVIRDNGVQDFLRSIPLPVWVTESGAQGIGEQLKYVEQTWPFLDDRTAGIERFYYYQMYERTPPQTTYALRNGSAQTPLSDLYVWLRGG
jgi:hypothetical protein